MKILRLALASSTLLLTALAAAAPGDLYGLGSFVGGGPSTLYTVDRSDGHLTLDVVLTNTDGTPYNHDLRGTGITFLNDTLYLEDGHDLSVVDLTSGIVTPVAALTGSALFLTADRTLGLFYTRSFGLHSRNSRQ